MKDTYFFYFPQNNEEQLFELEAFEEVCEDLAGGKTTIYPARGSWIDPSGLKIEDKIAIVNVSGNFDKVDSDILETLFTDTLHAMGEHSGFYNRNGVGYMKELKP